MKWMIPLYSKASQKFIGDGPICEFNHGLRFHVNDQYQIKAGYQSHRVNTSIEEYQGDYWDRKRTAMAWYCQWDDYRTALRLIKKHQLKTVLDVGCGVGHKLMSMLAPHATVTGVDQATAVAVARKSHPQGRFVAMNLEKPTPIEGGPFDVILNAGVIEHLLDPDQMLNWVREQCHANSWFIISTAERDVLRGQNNLRSPHEDHVREWNKVEFAAYLESRGFRVIAHQCVAPFRLGWSQIMWKERWRLLRKGIAFKWLQQAICQRA